jgi:hypothetical protein
MSSLRSASKESGRSVPEILTEMLNLRRAVGRMGVTEYFDFRLFMNDLSLEEKQCFGGRRAQQVLDEILVDDFSEFLSLDKPTMYSLFRDANLPIPKVRALYATRRPSKAYRCLASADELAAYLKDSANVPVYIKRSCGSYGRGNTLIASVEGEDLVLGDGSRTKLQAFCESLDSRNGLGWILQEPLKADPQIAKLCGDKISGVRVHTFATANGPQIHRAIWKINIGNKDSDNFQHGGSGNMLAQLDPDTGTALRVVAGMQFAQTVNPLHPVTQAPLQGFVVPHWNEIRELVLDAALTFPGFICPGWDVAVCADGPKLLEVNSFGDIDLSQHAFRRGFIDPQFIGFMRSRGLDAYLYGRPGKMTRSKITSRIGSPRELHWTW